MIRKFAEECYETNKDKYSSRGQSDKKKIIKDIYTGKIAEYMVYDYLVERGYVCTEPDVQIYEARRKSFDADLMYGNEKVHVKSHVPNRNYPVSWIFQKYDPLVKEPTLKDYMALCVLADRNPYFFLLKSTDMVYGKPIKELPSKVCVYEEDLLMIEKFKI